MTEKRYEVISSNLECGNDIDYMLIKRNDGVNVCQVCSKYTAKEIVDELNSLADENEQLKQSVNNLKETILKITIAYQRKYDRTIVDLVDEVHDEDITDLIKELQE